MKNLVIGMVKGYTFEQIRPFVVTLRSTGFSGDVVLIHDNTQEVDIRQMADHGVLPISVGSLLSDAPAAGAAPRTASPGGAGRGFLGRAGGRLRAIWSEVRAGEAGRNCAVRAADPHCVRYQLYLRYLVRKDGAYANVLLTDVRDVLFQRDPFEWAVDGLGVSLDDDRSSIR